MLTSGKETVDYYNKLEQLRGNHDNKWERMAPYLSPSRVGITGKRAEGDDQTRGVYDSTGMSAAELMAHFIAGNVINPGQQWAGYTMRDPKFRQFDQLNEWLEENRDRSLKRLASSMFYAEGPESLIDWGGFGTGCLMGGERPQPINETIKGFRGFQFEAVKTGRFVIDQGGDGSVNVVGRKFEMSAGAIEERWNNLPGAHFPENIQQALRESKREKIFTIIHMIQPRRKAEQGAGAIGMPWASIWCEKESKGLIQESGYRRFPAIVPRFHRTPDEIYGRGRGHLAFPDIWTLNTAKRYSFEDWALKVRPPILHRHNSVFGSLRLVPGAPTSVNTHGMRIQDVIMPYQTGSNPEVSQINEENLRKSINQIFFVQQILELLEMHKSELTAYEFHKKLEVLFQLIGPVYGRLQWEFLYAVMDYVFDTQLAEGDFSDPPPEIFQTDGDINIEFENPLARAQRAADAESVTLAINDLSPFAEMAPQVFDEFDPDEIAVGICNVRGVPAKWRRSPEQKEKLRSERQKQNEKQLAMEDAAQLSEVAKNVAPLAKDGGLNKIAALAGGRR